MSEFLTTLATTARIESIISKAKKHIVLVSPYLRWSPLLFARLQEADRRGVPIVFIYGKSDLHVDQRKLLDQISNLSLYFSRNLHAKCYFNEQELIVSSLNLHEYSERNNREMSVVFKTSDRVFVEAVTEVQLIMDASELKGGHRVSLVEKRVPAKRTEDRGGRPSRTTAGGYCIRCKDPIPLSRDRPHCNDCYWTWSAFENYEYEEKYCHVCGANSSTSKARPLCNDCFRNDSSW